ncbi:DedA family protein [Nocardioides sp.]|uniref:DedA family protein n=1 Tax=Nocardioides sp. TaxID=35761 RepID=UPI002ED95544
MTGLVEHLLSLPVWLGLLVVFGLPALEASAFVGFLFPGEIAVLLGGVAAGQGHLPLAAVLAAAIGGAVAGDAVGYLVGQRWGTRILRSSVGRFVKADHLERASDLLARRGGPAVLLGRFTVALRVLVPGLAGMAGMPYRTFALFNVAGAAAWGGGVVLAGYLAGNSWHTVEHVISGIGVGLAVVVVAALLGARLLRRRSGPRAGRLHRSFIRVRLPSRRGHSRIHHRSTGRRTAPRSSVG